MRARVRQEASTGVFEKQVDNVYQTRFPLTTISPCPIPRSTSAMSGNFSQSSPVHQR